MNLLYQILADKPKTSTALLYNGKSFSFGDVISFADKVATTLLKCGLKKGEIVTVALPNIPEAAYLFYGINKAGGIAHMSHPLLPPNQLQAQMKLTNSRFLFATLGRADELYPMSKENKIKLVYLSPAASLGNIKDKLYCLKNNIKKPKNIDSFYDFIKISQIDKIATVGFDPHSLDDEETSILLNSGGTGGEPKTVELSSFALMSLCKGAKNLFWRDDLTGAHILSVLPFFHGFGLALGLQLMVQYCGVNVLMPRFNRDDTINYLKKGQLNYIVGVPTLYSALLAHPEFNGEKLKHIETAFVGGDLVPQKLLDDFTERLKQNGSNGVLFEGYGLTEAVTVTSCNTHKSFKARSVGRPIEGVTIKALKTEISKDFIKKEKDDGNVYGELCIGGDTLMNGYFKDEKATNGTFITDDDGQRLLCTGDYGYIDSDGFVFFKQRLKRILKVGGVTVFPAEIEQIACSVNGVNNVCAFDIPDERKGTKIILAVETTDEDTKNLEILLTEKLTKTLNIDSLPSKIVFYKTFPMTALNKIDINKLVASV